MCWWSYRFFFFCLVCFLGWWSCRRILSCFWLVCVGSWLGSCYFLKVLCYYFMIRWYLLCLRLLVVFVWMDWFNRWWCFDVFDVVSWWWFWIVCLWFWFSWLCWWLDRLVFRYYLLNWVGWCGFDILGWWRCLGWLCFW